MLNFKQEEVLQKIIAKLQENFPDVQLVSVFDLGASSFWVSVTDVRDEAQQLEFDDVMAELTTDALMDYGVNFQFVPTNGMKAAA